MIPSCVSHSRGAGIDDARASITAAPGSAIAQAAIPLLPLWAVPVGADAPRGLKPAARKAYRVQRPAAQSINGGVPRGDDVAPTAVGWRVRRKRTGGTQRLVELP